MTRASRWGWWSRCAGVAGRFRSWRHLLAVLAGLAGSAGVGSVLRDYPALLGLPSAVVWLLALTPAVALTFFFADWASDPEGAVRRNWPVAVLSGLWRLAPTNLALAMLLFRTPTPQWGREVFLLGVLGLATLAWTLRATWEGSARPVLLLARPADRGKWSWWVVVFSISASVVVLYLVIGARARGINDNDAAYYFGVARHIVTTGRFEEPIVWHFLKATDSLTHAPFDYWGPMASLALVPSLAVFGATQQVALITVAFISGLSVLAFAYVIAVAIPLRHALSQLLALLFFAFSPGLHHFRFDTESIAIYHLCLLLSLAALGRRRYYLSVVFAFALVLTRGDGMIPFAIIVSGVLWAAQRGRGWKFSLRILGLAGGLLVLRAVWCTVSFGTASPPGPAVAPFLLRYNDMYDWGAVPELQRIWSVLSYDYFAERMRFGLDAFRSQNFIIHQDLWVLFGLLPGLGLLRRRRLGEVLVWFLFFGFLILVPWGSGRLLTGYRSLLPMLPLLVLFGAFGLDELLTLLDHWTRKPGLPLARACIVSIVLAVGFFFLTERVAGYTERKEGQFVKMEKALASLDGTLGGQPVASNVPWYVIANTRSPALMVPGNGVPAIEAAFRRYRIRWVALLRSGNGWASSETRSLLARLSGARSQRIGGLHLTRVEAPEPVVLFRVSSSR